MNKFWLLPSCPEVRLLYTCPIILQWTNLNIFLAKNLNSDPFLLYRCEIPFHPFDLIYLSAFGDASVRQISIPKALPRLGLDNEFYELRVQLQIQLAHKQNNYFDLQSLVSSHTDQLLRSSGYDPFKLALHSAQLKKLDPHIFTSSTKELEPRLPCDLTFVVGLPSPHWSQLQMILRAIDEYAIIDSLNTEKVFTSFTNLVGNGYPATLGQLTKTKFLNFAYHIFRILQFVLEAKIKRRSLIFCLIHLSILVCCNGIPESRFIAPSTCT